MMHFQIHGHGNAVYALLDLADVLEHAQEVLGVPDLRDLPHIECCSCEETDRCPPPGTFAVETDTGLPLALYVAEEDGTVTAVGITSAEEFFADTPLFGVN